ncbi:MAG: DUF445 domain-containing protein [Micropruina sp.]|nr:DUF445 domain-containing protein [Micropruina sp.]
MKLIALSLLLIAAVIYAATLRWADSGMWGYVNAGAEAAMVGALADWFAVTALFRRPLGLPIPHTAIIPTRKDEIAHNLQDFFTENFLTEKIARERLASTAVGLRAGEWLGRDDNARRVVAELARVAKAGLRQVSDEDVKTFAAEVILPRLTKEPLAGMVGDLLDAIVVDGAHHSLVVLIFSEVHDWLRAHPEQFMDIVEERAPRWAPGFVGRRLAKWTYEKTLEWVWDIRRDRSHPTRVAIDQLLRQIAADLQHNPVIAERAEALKVRLFSHPQTGQTIVNLWATVRGSLDHALSDENSALWLRGSRAVQRFGASLTSDQELRQRLEARLSDVVAFMVTSYGPELSTVISHTIERWDGREAATRIELHIGRDLQFIRINGTVVGALAGLVIHALSHLIG